MGRRKGKKGNFLLASLTSLFSFFYGSQTICKILGIRRVKNKGSVLTGTYILQTCFSVLFGVVKNKSRIREGGKAGKEGAGRINREGSEGRKERLKKANL